MQIQRIPFPPIGSNMYVVTQGRDAIVLDPWPDETTMQRLQGYHVLLVLTHEHVDHISGLGRMQRALSARTLWQENCTPWLRNPGNTTPVLLAALSVSRGAEARDFLRTLQLKTETYAPDMTFGDHIVLDWGALHLEGYATPGHSRGSACYRIGPDAFFSGDSLVPGNAVVTRLRGGDAAVLMDRTVPFLRAPPREKCLTRAAESAILLERSKDSRWLDRGNPAEDASITMFLFCFRGFGRGNFFGRVSFTRR